jgi:hypothetical protein
MTRINTSIDLQMACLLVGAHHSRILASGWRLTASYSISSFNTRSLGKSKPAHTYVLDTPGFMG